MLDEAGSPIKDPVAALLAARDRAPLAMDAELRGRAGARAVTLSGAPLAARGGALVGAVIVLHDVTDHKRAERERRTLEAAFNEAQKLECVGVLAGGVAHDFNNLLTAILGNVSSVARELDPADPARQALLDAQHAAESAAALTRQLLAFSRKSAIAPEVLDVAAEVEGMAKMLGRSIGA